MAVQFWTVGIFAINASSLSSGPFFHQPFQLLARFDSCFFRSPAHLDHCSPTLPPIGASSAIFGILQSMLLRFPRFPSSTSPSGCWRASIHASFAPPPIPTIALPLIGTKTDISPSDSSHPCYLLPHLLLPHPVTGVGYISVYYIEFVKFD
jgi:hypothetical protein